MAKKLRTVLASYFFLEKPLYEIVLTYLKEQVKEKRSIVGTHMNAACLLKHFHKT
jgi:hypothetical protein